MKSGSSRNPFAFSKKERHYLEQGKEYPDLIYPAPADSVKEGFEYLFETRPDLDPFNRYDPTSANPLNRLRRMGIPLRAMGSMIKIMRSIQRGMSQSWEETEQYFTEREPLPFVPKPELWDDLILNERRLTEK